MVRTIERSAEPEHRPTAAAGSGADTSPDLLALRRAVDESEREIGDGQ
jgi:hypothetical protein